MRNTFSVDMRVEQSCAGGADRGCLIEEDTSVVVQCLYCTEELCLSRIDLNLRVV